MDEMKEFYISATNRTLSGDIILIKCQTHSEYVETVRETFVRAGVKKQQLSSRTEIANVSKGLTIQTDKHKYILIDLSQISSTSEEERIIFHELGHAGTADIFKTCFVSENDYNGYAGYKLLKELFACYDSNVCIKERYENLITDDVYDKCVDFFRYIKKNFVYSLINKNATALGECLSIMIIFFEKKLVNDQQINGVKISEVIKEYIRKTSISIKDCQEILEKLFLRSTFK